MLPVPPVVLRRHVPLFVYVRPFSVRRRMRDKHVDALRHGHEPVKQLFVILLVAPSPVDVRTPRSSVELQPAHGLGTVDQDVKVPDEPFLRVVSHHPVQEEVVVPRNDDHLDAVVHQLAHRLHEHSIEVSLRRYLLVRRFDVAGDDKHVRLAPDGARRKLAYVRDSVRVARAENLNHGSCP